MALRPGQEPVEGGKKDIGNGETEEELEAKYKETATIIFKQHIIQTRASILTSPVELESRVSLFLQVPCDSLF